MRNAFKVIAIIGVLSFFGGLKNGTIFTGGIILAGIFCYFGWRPEKDKSEPENHQLNTDITQSL